MVFMTYLSHNPTFFLHWLFVSSSSSSRWHPCSRHIWRTRPSPGTRTYWWCSQLSCVLPGRWPSVFFLLAMHNQTSFGSALASFVSCRGSSGCGCYGQDTMSHWPQKNPCNWRRLQLETKISKTQNENICLIYLNTEMNGNYHFLSFCALFLKVQNQVLWTSLSFQQSGWKNGFSWMIVHEKWAFQVALYSIFEENTHVFQTFSG